MKFLRILISLMVVTTLFACSGESTTEMTADKVQQMYNDMRGTYIGNVMVNNLPVRTYVTIDNELTVRQLPTEPILRRVFTDEKELEEAVASVPSVVFTAQTDNMVISGNNIMLSMLPNDLLFTAQVSDKTYHVAVRMTSTTLVNIITNELSLNMDATELYCDGQAYDVKTNSINYFIDIANKQTIE